MTHNTTLRARRGFTLIELIVGIVIFAIVGALFTKLLTVQGKFYDRQGMGNAARNVSRASLNRVVSDFRMIEATGGVVAATSTSLTIRIPFAIGVMCGNSAGGTVISLLPVDSTTYAEATFYGYAWRNFTTGAYSYVESPATRATADAAQSAICIAKQITTVPGGKIVYVTPVLPVGAGLGTPVFLYSRVKYEFKASVAVPGKLGLWRTEIAAGRGLGGGRAGSSVRQHRELEVLHGQRRLGCSGSRAGEIWPTCVDSSSIWTVSVRQLLQE